MFNQHTDFVHIIREAYATDKMYAAVIKDPAGHSTFQIKDGLIWTKNRAQEIVLCVPNVKYGEQSI